MCCSVVWCSEGSCSVAQSIVLGEGRLEVKLLTLWADEKQKAVRRESQRREEKRREEKIREEKEKVR